MKLGLASTLLWQSLVICLAAGGEPSAEVLVAVGAPGSEEYQAVFAEAAAAWGEAAAEGGAAATTIGLDGPDTEGGDLTKLRETVEGGATQVPLWIVLIGHGTFDGRDAKFNLRGDDLNAAALAKWLAGNGRENVIINTTAASAPFIKAISGEDRVVITATKSGSEESFARFGQFLAKAMAAPDADIDGDGGTSLLEAFLKASEDVAEFYEKEGRIATEQALIDDNGDGLGTPAIWFRGTRAIKNAKDDTTADGMRAHQLHLVPSQEERRMPEELRRRRDELEARLFTLREKKTSLGEAEYFEQLEAIALELSELYRSAGSLKESDAASADGSP